MKKLFAPGVVAVIAQARGLPTVDGKHHDYWLQHAAHGGSFDFVFSASGRFFFNYSFELLSGDTFFYLYAPAFDSLPAIEAYRAQLSALEFPLNFEGENFNYITRPHLILKADEAGLEAWLNSH
jgi:hypothetical protein